MAEGMSYLAACELPCVVINIMRAGPGLGGILPSQSDYFQATKGHGHGDYQLIVLAPASVQEAVDLMTLAFELAEKYRNPVMLCADGMIGQMMEPVEFPGEGRGEPFKDNTWALTGASDRPRRIVNSLFLAPEPPPPPIARKAPAASASSKSAPANPPAPKAAAAPANPVAKAKAVTESRAQAVSETAAPIAAASAPILPEAPTRFSTTTARLSFCDNLGPNCRATMSMPVPGVKGTIRRKAAGLLWA